MAISLLGPLQVAGNGQLSPRDRVVLSALAIRPGDVLSPEQLADALWREQPPVSWPKVVQGCVLRIRQSLGRDAVQTTSGGYRLALGDDEIDVRRFEHLVQRGRALTDDGQADRGAAVLSEALSLWRGRPLADLEHWAAGVAEADRLEELRRAAEEHLLDARLATGEDVVADATALVAAGPVREHRWWLLATALYRAGRQTDALAALRRARQTLQDELGLDPGEELGRLEHAILNHDASLARPVAPRAAVSDTCPYPGLVAYDKADADRFFGRDDEIARCLRVLRETSFVVVTGPSGSGKSSLVRAGVAPALEAAGRRVTVLTPGTDPSAALTAARSAARGRSVLVVDQLEELFTARHDPAVETTFLDGLVGCVDAGVPVVLVLRADHLGDLSRSAALARRVEQGLHLVAPMSQDELRQAVEEPARRAGLRLEPGLVELLLHEVDDEPGALPLLSHALAETWSRREGAVLTLDGYRATGGIRGAVAQTAERLWDELSPGQRGSTRMLLLRMVSLSADGEAASTRVPLAVVGADPDRRRLLDLLVRCRLVTTDDRSVAVAHEAVVRAWPRLRSWLDEDAAGQRMLRHLSVAAEDWQARGRPGSELYRGARLAAGAEWRERARPELTPTETAFLDAAVALAAEEERAAQVVVRTQARQNRRLRVALSGTALGLVLALVASLVAVAQSREQARTARAALVDELVARSTALRSTQRDLAALLAVEAHRLAPGPATRSALLGVFTAEPGFGGDLRTAVPAASAALLEDGRTLLAGGVDGVVRLIDVRNGVTRDRLPAPAGTAVGSLVAVSADGSTVAAVSWRRGRGAQDESGQSLLAVYDLASRTRRVADVVVPMDVGSVAVSADGRHVAVAGYRDARAFVFDLHAGGTLPELPSVDATAPGVVSVPPTGDLTDLSAVIGPGARHTAAVVFTPDGRLLVGSVTGPVRVVQPTTGKVLRSLTGAPQLTSNGRLALTADGTILVTAGSHGVVRWDLARGRRDWTVELPEGRCDTVALLEVRDLVLCGGRFGRVEARYLASGRPAPDRFDMQHGRVSGLLVPADGSTLVQTSSSQGVVTRWSLDGTGPVTRAAVVPGSPLGYDAAGRLVLTSGPEVVQRASGRYGLLRVLDAGSGRVVLTLTGYATAAWSGEPGRLLAWDAFGAGQLVDARSGRRVVALQGGFGVPPDGVAPPAGRGLALAWTRYAALGSRPVWEAWDVETGEIVGSGGLSGKPQLGASITAGGGLSVWSGDEVTMALRPTTGRVLARRQGLDAASVSPAGVVAASTSDGGLAFLAARTLRPLGPALPGSPGALQHVSWSRDGGLLAAQGGDQVVRLVDVDARLQLGEPISVGGDPGSASVRPDGQELLVPTTGALTFWDLRVSRWRAEACRLAGRTLTRGEWATHLAAAGKYRPACRG